MSDQDNRFLASPKTSLLTFDPQEHHKNVSSELVLDDGAPLSKIELVRLTKEVNFGYFNLASHFNYDSYVMTTGSGGSEIREGEPAIGRSPVQALEQGL